MTLDEVDIEEDEQANELFTRYTIDTVYASLAAAENRPSDPLESKFHPQTEKPESNEGWGVAQDANESTTTSMTWPSELTTAETAPAQLQPTILLRGVLRLVGAQIAKPQEKLIAAASFPAPSVPSVVPPAPEPVLGHPPSPPAVNGDAELVSEGWEDPTTVSSHLLQASEPTAPAPKPVTIVSALPTQIHKQDVPTQHKSHVYLSSRPAARDEYKGIDHAAVMPSSTAPAPTFATSVSQSSQPAAASLYQPCAPPMPYFHPYPQSQYYGNPYNQGFPTPFIKYTAPTPPAMFQHQHQPSQQTDVPRMGADVQCRFSRFADDIGYHQPPQQQTQNSHRTQ
ncbi:hypothetical protein EV702DRAFT_1240731 [Suillus placidus]|uniref:Uncharacterized protein n=1 Tax=Suillus placidus TaxID=48579 RepID=A0A9P7D0G3_9AGAM|nr:hypothetical protein EV702DRAFT_1240731 [Suillus placidus]